MNSHPVIEPPAYQGSSGQRVAVRQHAAPTADELSSASTPHILFCGGFHSTMLGTKANALAQLCQTRQWSYTRFDYRGHGESDGQPDAFTLHHWLDDTLAVLDGLSGRILLVGSSMGAWLATLATLRRPEKVRGLLLIAAAPDFLQELIAPQLGPAEIWDLQQDKAALINTDYDTPQPITQALLDSGRELSLLAPNSTPGMPSLANLACPVRLVHGTHDVDVPATLAMRLLQAIEHDDARLTLLNRADHRLSDARSLAFIQSQLQELVEHTASV